MTVRHCGVRGAATGPEAPAPKPRAARGSGRAGPEQDGAPGSPGPAPRSRRGRADNRLNEPRALAGGAGNPQPQARPPGGRREPPSGRPDPEGASAADAAPRRGAAAGAVTGRKGCHGGLPRLGVWRRGFPEQVSLEQGTNNLESKVGRGMCKGPEADPGGWSWAMRGLSGSGEPGFHFTLGWARRHKRLKDSCKLRRAECASPQQLPDGDTQAGLPGSKTGCR